MIFQQQNGFVMVCKKILRMFCRREQPKKAISKILASDLGQSPVLLFCSYHPRSMRTDHCVAAISFSHRPNAGRLTKQIYLVRHLHEIAKTFFFQSDCQSRVFFLSETLYQYARRVVTLQGRKTGIWCDFFSRRHTNTIIRTRTESSSGFVMFRVMRKIDPPRSQLFLSLVESEKSAEVRSNHRINVKPISGLLLKGVRFFGILGHHWHRPIVYTQCQRRSFSDTIYTNIYYYCLNASKKTDLQGDDNDESSFLVAL